MVIKQKSITKRYTAMLFLSLQGMTGGGGSPLSTLVDTSFLML